MKFHTPFPDEDPNQLYVVLELINDVERPRAHIKALAPEDYLNPINVVLAEDLRLISINHR